MNEQQTEIPTGTKVVVRSRGKRWVDEFFYLNQPGVVQSGPDVDGDYLVLQFPERYESDGEGWFIPGFFLDVIEQES